MKKTIHSFPAFFWFALILCFSASQTGCNGGEKPGDDKVPGQDKEKEELEGLINEKITAAQFVPKCTTEYTTNIYHRVLVEDCGKVTEEEKTKMVDELKAKAKNSAGQICALNPECPTPILGKAEVKRSVCKNRLWEADVAFKFVCIKEQ